MSIMALLAGDRLHHQITVCKINGLKINCLKNTKVW